MTRLLAFLRRSIGLFDRAQRDRETAAELELHLELHAEELARRGVPPEEARRRASIALGSIEAAKEAVRDQRGWPALESLAQDVRYALRGFRRQPGFTTFVVITLALGIGANTVVFSVLDAMLLRPLPYRDPARLLTIAGRQSSPDLIDIRARSHALESLAGVAIQPLDYTGGEQPIQVVAGMCDGPLADVLGVQPARGRWLTREEDRAGAPAVAVLSDGLWKRAFASDPKILGKSIPLSGKMYTVVGVMPAGFWLPEPSIDLWASVHVVYPEAAEFRGVHFMSTYLRLAPGATLASAGTEMKATDGWLAQLYPEENHGRQRRLVTLRARVVGDTRTSLTILAASVGCVLLIACVNFASLLLARGAARRRELVIRSCLGAGSRRLARQLLTEATLLSLLGGAAGFAFARIGIALLAPIVPSSLPSTPGIALDGRVLLFTFGASLATGLVFGLLPALAGSRLDLGDELRASGRAVAGERRGLRLRRLLVVSEFALALVLLAGAGLLLRSFVAIEHVAPGFRDADILTARLQLPAARYVDLASQRRFRAGLLEKLQSRPGIDAGLVSELPLSGDQLTHNFALEGAPSVPTGTEPEVDTRTISPEYLRILGIPLLRGRPFEAHDDESAPFVAAVNEAFVRAYLADRDPLGARVRWAHQEPPQWMTIVGVVGDVKQMRLDKPEEPAVYDPYTQTPMPWKRWMEIVVRGPGGPAALLAELRHAVAALDRDLPLTRVQTLRSVVEASVAEPRFRVLLLALFAAVALALAANGIYGVTAFAVAQESHAIGIRMALGAESGDILRRVLGNGGRLAAIGAGIGLLGALALTRWMSTLLFGVTARDPVTLAAVTAILGAVALLGCWIPARSATRVDPMTVLRSD